MPAPAKKTKTLPPPVERRERYTPMPDPPKKYDMLWGSLIAEVHTILKSRYRRDPTTLVGGKGYIFQSPDDSGYAVFDCVVAFGVEAERLIWEANAYVVSEAGKPPDFILDIATRRTQSRNYPIKRRIYQDMGAVEYWRFDASGGRFYDAPLAGDVLVDGEYHPIKIRRAEDGSLWGYSRALGLYPVLKDGRLRFFDPVRGEFLLNFSETMDRIAENERRAEESDRRADEAIAATIENERRAAGAEADAARIAAERRADEAEAEAGRLRRLLGDSE